ncbi:hypothetical protein DFH27DRAFT_207314 [Peziza echinospora]|nr:hypothetical protein DFH27DRAFT_207314 [Peziza echinospora]
MTEDTGKRPGSHNLPQGTQATHPPSHLPIPSQHPKKLYNDNSINNNTINNDAVVFPSTGQGLISLAGRPGPRTPPTSTSSQNLPELNTNRPERARDIDFEVSGRGGTSGPKSPAAAAACPITGTPSMNTRATPGTAAARDTGNDDLDAFSRHLGPGEVRGSGDGGAARQAAARELGAEGRAEAALGRVVGCPGMQDIGREKVREADSLGDL